MEEFTVDYALRETVDVTCLHTFCCPSELHKTTERAKERVMFCAEAIPHTWSLALLATATKQREAA